MAVPQTHRAVVVIEGKKIEVKEKVVPVLQPDTVLIKVKAVSVNPTDYKHIDDFLAPGASLGMDFSGDIVQVGSEVTTFKVGDAVAGFIRGGFEDPDNAAFQEYVRAYPELIWPKPARITYEEAASMGGIVLSTPVQALYHRLKLPPPWKPTSTPLPIVIWAGSTSVGQNAIALAKLSGLQVATTGSPHNHELLKRIGADVVFDYKDPAAAAKIRAWSEGKIEFGLDNFGEKGSTLQTALSFGPKGGKLITLRPIPERTAEWPDHVEVERIFIYTILNRGSQDYKDIVEWYKELPALIESGKLNPTVLKHWEGGLEGINSALQYLRDGKASAEKITLTL